MSQLREWTRFANGKENQDVPKATPREASEADSNCQTSNNGDWRSERRGKNHEYCLAEESGAVEYFSYLQI